MDCTCKEKKDSCDCKTSNEKFFEAWTKSLEEQEQPQACDIQDEDCENCGS